MDKKVVVLLSTYNGEQYLEEQLKSIFSQTYKNILIIVRDDGSSDGTCDILKKYEKYNNLTWYKGENIGFALSFMHLLYNSPDAAYYAFCDQDDIWHSDKIEAAVSMIEEGNFQQPILYVSNQTYVDKNGKKIKERFTDVPNTNFEARFMRGYFSGCTMVFNLKLKKYIMKGKGKVPDEFIKRRWHDTWVLQVCSAVGEIIYDPISHIDYRRHDTNSSQNDESRIKRHINAVSSTINDKSRKNLRYTTANLLIELYGDSLSKEKLTYLEDIINYKKSLGSKLKLAFNKNIILTEPETRLEFIIKVFMGWI